MSRTLRRLALALCVFVLVVGSMGVGAAQTDGTIDVDNASDLPGELIEDSDSEDDGPESVLAQIDEDVRVTSARYDATNETFFVTVVNKGDRRARLRMTEMVDVTQDRQEPIGIRKLSMRGGEEVVVEIDARMTSGSAGIMVYTEQSVEQGRAEPIQYHSGWSLVDGPATWSDVTVGVAVALAMGVVGLLLGVWEIVARKNRDVTKIPIS